MYTVRELYLHISFVKYLSEFQKECQHRKMFKKKRWQWEKPTSTSNLVGKSSFPLPMFLLSKVINGCSKHEVAVQS